jgi:UDP-N-acetylmuramate--alanine ligase
MSLKIDRNNKKLSFHIVGIFGIGMSGLAQYLKWKGYHVSGSDRALKFPENELLFNSLSGLGIKLYNQNGSFIKNESPNYIVYSTAIEEDNADFTASEAIPRLHRTELLVELFEENSGKTTIAVAGTCGKTTVSSLVAETFEKLELDPLTIVGGFVNSFISEHGPGNFKPGNGNWMIFESDESDKSLLRFYPDYTVLLNIGTDHYSKEELIIVFEKFLQNTKIGAVIEKNLYELLNPKAYEHLKIVLFSSDGNPALDKNMWYFNNYSVERNKISVDFRKDTVCKHFMMPVPGRYNAGNFLAAYALYELLELNNEIDEDDYLNKLSSFKGVHRRFEYAGLTSENAHVYCDFAHNVNKIESAVNCAKELTNGRVFVIFQPHAYKSLRFMQKELYPVIENSLDVIDRFIFMPVYYSGGTCVAEPKVEDVIAEYTSMSKAPEKFISFELRSCAENYLKKEAKAGDIILIMGARDNSLPIWANELAKKN